MEKVLNVAGKMPLSVSTALAISLAGGLSVALVSFKEFAYYLLKM